MNYKDSYERIRTENNTFLIKLYFSVMSIAFIACMTAEFLAISGVHKWIKSLSISALLVFFAVLPLILRKLKSSEKLITIVLLNIFIAVVVGLIFIYPHNLNLWTLSFCVIIFSILFLDTFLLVYSGSIMIVTNIVYIFIDSKYLNGTISGALIGRLGIFAAFYTVSFFISIKYKQILHNNLLHSETITVQNERNVKMLENIKQLSKTLNTLTKKCTGTVLLSQNN
jgi:hypothetical protein